VSLFVFKEEKKMNEIIEKQVKIENMIYEIRGVQVMLDSEISVTKCHYYIYHKIINTL